MPVSKELMLGLKTAYDLEKKSYEFYKKKYDELESQLFRELLLFLAEQEKNHMAYITALKASLLKTDTWTVISDKTKSPDFFSGLKRIEHTTHEIEILHLAMDFEKKARDFYINLTKISPAKEAKDFFSKMAAFEDSHVNLLDGLYGSSMYVRLET
jgi:rubrerythrin